MTVTAIPARDLSRISTSLVLRTCDADGTSHRGFVWPEVGPVACSDWEPTAECGHGLHGALWGEGDSSLFRWGADARWQVLEVPTDTIVDLGGKVKFPSATVLFTGDRLAATAFLVKRAPGRAIIGGTATVGDGGTATAGYRGTATAGYDGTAAAGNDGTATAGNYGTATVGYRGTATAGDGGIATAGYRGTATAGNDGTATAGSDGTAAAGYRGTICVWWHDGRRYRLAIGYVGENGLDAGTAYRCDRDGQLVAATA